MLLLTVMREWSLATKGSRPQKTRTTSSVMSAAGAVKARKDLLATEFNTLKTTATAMKNDLTDNDPSA